MKRKTEMTFREFLESKELLYEVTEDGNTVSDESLLVPYYEELKILFPLFFCPPSVEDEKPRGSNG